VVAYAPEDLCVTVRAGTPLTDLDTTLAEDGLWVPLVSPWAGSTIGGVVSTNLNGPARMRYGAVRDLVLGVRVVLSDGRRLRFGRPVVKNVAGYDMAKLFVGAHGTLGLITEVTLRLMPLPRARRGLLLPLEDLALGLSLGRSLLELSFVASSVLLCRGCPHPTDVPPAGDEASSLPYTLAFTAEGHPQDVAAELRAARMALASAGASAMTETKVWTGTDLWANLLRDNSSYWRIGVSPSNLPAYLEANASALAGDRAEPRSYVADFASGLIHVSPGTTAGILSLRQAALALGGYAVVSEPGAAPGDGDPTPWGYAPETLPLMRRLKARWGPAGCLNPGVFMEL
jgi:D-lactate dehydrogenase (cytochrome)